MEGIPAKDMQPTAPRHHTKLGELSPEMLPRRPVKRPLLYPLPRTPTGKNSHTSYPLPSHPCYQLRPENSHLRSSYRRRNSLSDYMASPPDGSGPLAPPPVTVTFMVILITFFILGMLSICFCRCCSQHLWNGHQANAAGGSAARNGLDPSVIRSFPTLVYSNVKHLRRENYELECAICLLEFEGESVLRLLTACYHVFHQECIDLWLESHKSCPVCRGNLDLSPEKIQDKFPAALHENNNMPDIQENSETFFEDAISIEIEDNEEEKGMRSSERTATTSTVPGSIDKLPRWNSTGHSIVKDRSSGCRYTLRLPDNVRVRVSKGHSGSCITFGGLGVRSHVAFDELPGCSKGKGSIG